MTVGSRAYRPIRHCGRVLWLRPAKPLIRLNLGEGLRLSVTRAAQSVGLQPVVSGHAGFIIMLCRIHEGGSARASVRRQSQGDTALGFFFGFSALGCNLVRSVEHIGASIIAPLTKVGCHR